jgi:nicotinamide mononucleotide adenylyltransferase
MGRDHFRMNTQYEVVGGYFSPVSDVYRKNGLAPSHHRYVPTAPMAHADVTSITD